MHPCARTWKELFLKTKIVISPNYAHGEPENCGIGVSVFDVTNTLCKAKSFTSNLSKHLKLACLHCTIVVSNVHFSDSHCIKLNRLTGNWIGT